MNKPRFPTLSLRDRILLYSHIDQGGCWLWQGLTFKKTGYAQITHRGKIYSGHRLSMHVFRSFDLCSEDLILHHCDVKRCLNPYHLYVGNHLDNTRDALMRNRILTGSRHPVAKLNEVKVEAIKRSLREGVSIKELAQRYAVDSSTIALIRRNKTWTHVKETK